MTLLKLEKLTVRRGSCPVVDQVDLTVAAGEFIGLIGPNGAGKTSLLRAALGLLPHEGRSSLAALSRRERARTAAFLPQGREIAWPLPVAELVALGQRDAPEARRREAAASALATMGLAAYAARRATELSGGEQARVLIARALAEETPLLLADEPCAGLDPAAQIRTMEVFAGLAREGRTVVASIHDLGLSARHCTRLLLLSGGKLVADGPPAQVLTRARLAEVFHISAHLAEGPEGLIFQPLSVVT